MNHISNDDIRYICNVFFEALGVPISFEDEDGASRIELKFGGLKRPCCFNAELERSSAEERQDGVPFFITTAYFERYFFIQYNGGLFSAGPVLTKTMEEIHINNLIEEHGFSIRHKKEIRRYYEFVPRISAMRFFKSAELLFFMVYGKPTAPADDIDNQRLPETHEKKKIEYQETTKLHHSTELEYKLLDLVAKGDVENVKKAVDEPLDGDFGLTIKNDPIRNLRNIFISMATSVADHVIRQGMDSEEMLTLADAYIQTAETKESEEKILNLGKRMYIDYAKRMRSHRMKGYSRSIYSCIRYIEKNYSAEIKMDSLCAHVSLSSGYLSRRFKKETGTTISSFIQQKRIEAAKKMLKHTDYSILDICLFCGFSDQSYFTNIFKKTVGLTPRKYRESASGEIG